MPRNRDQWPQSKTPDFSTGALGIHGYQLERPTGTKTFLANKKISRHPVAGARPRAPAAGTRARSFASSPSPLLLPRSEPLVAAAPAAALGPGAPPPRSALLPWPPRSALLPWSSPLLLPRSGPLLPWPPRRPHARSSRSCLTLRPPRCRGEARRIGIGQPLITTWVSPHGQAEAYVPGAVDLGLAEATAPTPCSVEDSRRRKRGGKAPRRRTRGGGSEVERRRARGEAREEQPLRGGEEGGRSRRER